MIKIIKFFKSFQKTTVVPINEQTEKNKNSEFKKDTYKNFISQNKYNSNI